MKKLLIVLPLCAFLFMTNIHSEQSTLSKEEEPIETRYVETVVPIYAICNYNNHKKIYGTVRFDGRVISTSGRVVYSGTTPIYVYSYIDEYRNYYEPYYSGYTYVDEDYAYVPGCPLN